MKKLFYLIFLIPLFTISSCDKKNTDGPDTTRLTSIQVSPVENEIYTGVDTFVFRVWGNDQVNYSSESTIYVNDEAITEDSYTPLTAGSYEVYATKGGLTSSAITVTASPLDIVIASDRTTTYVELEPYTFTATGSNGRIYTSTAVFFINGNQIADNVFNPDAAGDYDVYAVIGDDVIISPTITVSATVGYSSLEASSDKSCYLTGETAEFSAIDNLGRDLSDSTTYTVGGTTITGNTHEFTTSGSFDIIASYDGISSDAISVIVAVPTHTTKVLVEQYTGTTCVWCPRVTYKLDEAMTNNPNIITIAVHGAFSGSADPYLFPDLSAMGSALGVSTGGAPQAFVNRHIDWNEQEAVLTAEQANKVGLGLALNSTISGNNLSVEVKVGFDLPYCQQDYNLVLALLENGLLHNQSNATSYYGGSNPIVNFEHNRVLRKFYTPILGDEIPNAEIVAGGEYTQSFNVTVPTNVENNANLTLVAYVVEANTKKVVNVQKADVGVNQDFD